MPVSNFGGEDCGRIDLVTATEHSVNTVYVALAQEVGPKAVARHGAQGRHRRRRAGSPTRTATRALGIALGIYGVPVIDQASGFSTFAARGVAAEPFMVK